MRGGDPGSGGSDRNIALQDKQKRSCGELFFVPGLFVEHFCPWHAVKMHSVPSAVEHAAWYIFYFSRVGARYLGIIFYISWGRGNLQKSVTLYRNLLQWNWGIVYRFFKCLYVKKKKKIKRNNINTLKKYSGICFLKNYSL